jgi:hypothetical protein
LVIKTFLFPIFFFLTSSLQDFYVNDTSGTGWAPEPVWMMWRREKLYMSHLLIIAAWLVELTTN